MSIILFLLLGLIIPLHALDTPERITEAPFFDIPLASPETLATLSTDITKSYTFTDEDYKKLQSLIEIIYLNSAAHLASTLHLEIDSGEVFRVGTLSDVHAERLSALALTQKTINNEIESAFKSEKSLNNPVIKNMLSRILINTFTELFIDGYYPSEMSWCTCTKVSERLAFAVRLVQEIRNKFKNTTKKLIYTSFGSGNLLQDYLTLSELLLSHPSIQLHLIDFNYQYIPYGKKATKLSKKHTSTHLEGWVTGKKIDFVKTRLVQYVSAFKKSVTYFSIDLYSDAYTYSLQFKRAKGNARKPDVLVSVDPDSDMFAAEYPSQANALLIKIVNESGTQDIAGILAPQTVRQRVAFINKEFELNKDNASFIESLKSLVAKASTTTPGTSVGALIPQFVNPFNTFYAAQKPQEMCAARKATLESPSFEDDEADKSSEPVPENIIRETKENDDKIMRTNSLCGRIADTDVFIFIAANPELTFQDLINTCTQSGTIAAGLLHKGHLWNVKPDITTVTETTFYNDQASKFISFS